MTTEVLTEEEPKNNPKPVEDYLEEHGKTKEEILDAVLVEIPGLKEGEFGSLMTNQFETKGKKKAGHQINFYNPSKAFQVGEKWVEAFRSERRGSRKDSRVLFYELDDNGRPIKQVEGAPVLEGYEDPFYLGEIQGQKIFGAVKTERVEVEIEGEIKKQLKYKTEFFRFGDSLEEMEKFAEGPEQMKDIRFKELPSGKIGVYIRPQDGKYGRGQIGYLEIENLDKLEEKLKNFETEAKIFDKLFAPGEWGAVNDTHVLKNGKIGLIGHIAHFTRDEKGEETKFKEYYVTAAIFDPKTKEIANVEIILTKEEIEEKLGMKIDSKDITLKSIVFPGGSERKNDGTMILYLGVGDTHTIIVTIKDPFLKYENE